MKVFKLLVAMLLVTGIQFFASEQQDKKEPAWWDILLMTRHRIDGRRVDTRVSDCWNDQETCSKCCCATCVVGCCICSGMLIQQCSDENPRYQPSDHQKIVDVSDKKNN